MPQDWCQTMPRIVGVEEFSIRFKNIEPVKCHEYTGRYLGGSDELRGSLTKGRGKSLICRKPSKFSPAAPYGSEIAL